MEFFAELLHYHVARYKALLKEAAKDGHEVNLYAVRPKSQELPVAGYHGLLGEHVRVLVQDEKVSLDSPQAVRALLAALDRDSPDAVAIIGYSQRTSRAALGWCRYNRRGAVLMLESRYEDFPRVSWREWAKSLLVRCFDAVFAGGTPQAAYARALGVPPERIFTGYDVVDNAFWAEWAERVRQEPDVWRHRLELPDRYFITACRFVEKKNLEGLIKAYAQYCAKAGGKAWDLVVCGGGPLEDKIRALIAQLGLQSKVHLLGYLTADQMGPVYGLASAFVLASSHAEQWGLVVNEAMAAGLPVLVSQACGCAADLVVEGITGFTFDPHDAGQLAQLMERLSSGSIDRVQMGRVARERVALWSPENFALNLLKAAEVAIEYANARRRLPWLPPRMWP
jgi:glycosyltransferase involved in cell wall biosynthesis